MSALWVALALLAAPAAAQVKDVEGPGLPVKWGRAPSDKSFQGKYFTAIIGMLTDDVPAGGRSEGPMTSILKFINDEGCRQDAKGAKTPVDEKDYKATIKATLEKTEVVFVTRAEMNKLNAKAGAFGITAAFKETLQLDIGSKGRNTLAVVVPLEEKKPDPSNDVKTGAHEALHIVLTGFGNPKLGGGAKLAESGAKAVAFEHHRLTDYLHWIGTQAQAAGNPWAPPEKMPSCL